MEHVYQLMEELLEEGVQTEIRIRIREDGLFSASVIDTEDQHGILDQNGEYFLSSHGETPQQALSELDNMVERASRDLGYW